jgi:hypothetical protein
VLLVLLAALRRIRDPIAPAAGLRASIEVVLQFADLAGIDPACADRPRSILPDSALLPIVQAAAALRIIQYVLGLVKSNDPAASAALPISGAQDVALPLPTVIQVGALARKPDT